LRLNPFLLFGTLAFRTVPVPAGIIGDADVSAAVTAIYMRTYGIRPAASYGIKGFLLIR
jgi:hypothetical protein